MAALARTLQHVFGALMLGDLEMITPVRMGQRRDT
jgi:hypothetical protein